MIKKYVNLIFEALHLKDKKHEGRRKVGVQFPDSVAEHSLNAAQIGYILAHMEGADVGKVVKMLIWHDLGETRIGDMDKVTSRYFPKKKEIEHEVLAEQLKEFNFGEELLGELEEYTTRSTLEGNIAKDADYLEQAFQAKMYIEIWHAQAQQWIDNVGNALQTESAQQLWKEMLDTSFMDWRYDLPAIPGR